MRYHNYQSVEPVEITDDMEKVFKIVIRDTLKKCMGVYNCSEDEFDDFLLFNTYDKEYVTIGCVDEDNLVLESHFIYKRLDTYWDKWKKAHKDAPSLPKESDFYTALYCYNVLPYGIFFQEPQYQFPLGDDKKLRWYFFIPKKYVGYKSSMVRWV